MTLSVFLLTLTGVSRADNVIPEAAKEVKRAKLIQFPLQQKYIDASTGACPAGYKTVYVRDRPKLLREKLKDRMKGALQPVSCTTCTRQMGGNLGRLREWMCYQPLRCCPKQPCNCRESPLYTHFLYDCAQGASSGEVPCQDCGNRGVIRRLLPTGQGWFGGPCGHGGCGLK